MCLIFKMGDNNQKAGFARGANRNAAYDVIRVVAMSFVLAQHTMNAVNHYCSENRIHWFLYNLLAAVFMTCNSLFFMISGKFNLNKKFDSVSDYKIFYIKKGVSILLPFFLISVLMYILKFPIEMLGIKDFLKLFLNGGIEPTYWFMYVLIGITALSPFYSKMLQTMSKTDKKVFFWVSFSINAAVTVVSSICTTSRFTYGYFSIITWHTMYFLGYIAEDVFDTEKSRKTVIALGAISVVACTLISRFFTICVSVFDPTPWMFFQSLAMYFILLKINIKSEKVIKVISYIAAYSFTFYLLHMYFLDLIMMKIIKILPNIWSAVYAVVGYCVSYIIVIACSAVITALIIKPLQKLILNFAK